ncbi:MAG: hypothetical protein JXA10_12010, partial [Anaerolineae bacterium]|nr:hypothetical protein [Anaerolineae bacterium]
MHALRNLTMQRLMVAILFMLLFVMAVRAPTDPDLWWHIRGGEYIVENLAVPKTDSFSYTLKGENWIDGGWGTQIFIYGAYKLFGGDRVPGDSGNIGLALFTAITATAGLAIVYRMCEGTVYVRAFALVLGAAAAAIFWSPRPHMASFVLTALLLYLIHLYKREHVDRLWLIPPMFALWANLHAGFTIGFVLLVGVLVGEAFGNWFNPDDDRVIKWPRLKKIALVTVLAVPMLVINPYGFRLYAFPFDTVNVGVLQDFIQEWASPNFHRPGDWPFAFLLLGVLATAGLSSRRIDWTDLLLVGGTAFVSLVAARNIATFALVAT